MHSPPVGRLDARQTRRQDPRLKGAKFPRMKALNGFDFAATSAIPAGSSAALADGSWITRGEPLVLSGDSGTGKTHLLICSAPNRTKALSGSTHATKT